MILTADYHTHTKYSHGKGTVLQNAERAKELGLKELGITDHGFNNPAFGMTKKKLEPMRRDIEEAKRITGVNVLMGIEANMLGEEGYTDLKEEYYPLFDLFLCGAHRYVKFKRASDYYHFFWRNFFNSTFKIKPPKSLVERTTRAYVNMIKRCPIDAITHLNFLYFSDAEEVAKCARDYGTYIELNCKKVHLSDEELAKVRDTGVRFLINSDAHSVNRVGETRIVDELLSRVEIPREQIDNIDGRLPDLRFRRYKKEHI